MRIQAKQLKPMFNSDPPAWQREATMVLFIAAVGVVMALAFGYIVYDYCLEACYAQHNDIINGTSISPWSYRVLVPYTIEWGGGGASMGSNAAAYLVGHVVMLPVALFSLYAWLRAGAATGASLSGVMLIAVTLPLIFHNRYGTGLWSIVELAIFCAALLVINRPLVFGFWVMVAALNRETAVLLPLAFALWHLPKAGETGRYALGDRRYWRDVVILFGMWATVFVGLRLVIGAAPAGYPPRELFIDNVQRIGEVLLPLALTVPVVVMVFAGRQMVDAKRRRLLWAAVAYLPLYVVFGSWMEIRLLLTIVPFAMPVIIAASVDEPPM